MSDGGSETGFRDRALDGWRGLAITGVLFDHFITSEVINVGRFGVELFFVLSGRLMADILFVRHTPLWHFFPRRVARIYPTLFCFATTIWLISLVVYNLGITPQAYLSAITLTANYVSIFWRRTLDYDHLWSLCIEEHMYILLGIIAAVTRRNGASPARIIAVLAGVAMVVGAVQTWGWHFSYKQAYWRSDVRGASILIGALAFLLLRDAARRPAWLNHPASPICFALMAGLLNVNVVPDPIKYTVGTMCLATGLVTLGQAAPWWNRIFGSRLLVGMGIVSYSIYVWQEPFGEIEDRWVRFATLPLVFGCGLLSFYLVEQPARRALNRLFAPGPSRAAGPELSTPRAG